ncbi:MAG TPA: hypothetical protein VKX25_18280 [Bryobacteraceae bacterium]|nr:hypothetical protein [Bryobacteraceae bacterium]
MVLSQSFAHAALLVLRVADYFLLLSAVFCAAVRYTSRRESKAAARPISYGLLAIAASGYLAFWIWLASPGAGYIFSLLVPLCCAVYSIRGWRGFARQKRVLSIWLLLCPAALIVLAAGFLYGGMEQPLLTAESRFSHTLPSDNALPLIFADQLENGKIERPMIGDWLSSDRPPLQTGLTLLIYPYRLASRTLSYMLVGVLLQILWIPALWVLLDALEIRRRQAAWILAAVFASGFSLLNTFFVWPKLLAAAFGLAFAALLFLPGDQRNTRTGFIAGALLAFSLLSHGGAAFFALGLAASYPAWRSRARIPIRTLGWMLAGLAICYAPWAAYQKFVDPPGDRLLKMHFAGIAQPDPRPFAKALADAYAPLSAHDILAARLANLETVFDHELEYANGVLQLIASRTRAEASDAAREIRRAQFFYLSPALGFYLVGVPLLAAGLLPRFRRPAWKIALLGWSVALATALIWCALLFEANAAVLHQGAYAMVLLALAASLLSLWNVSPLLARITILLQTVLTIAAYVVTYTTRPDIAQLLLLCASLGVFLATLRWISMERDH